MSRKLNAEQEREDAYKQAKLLKEYWRKKGHSINVELVKLPAPTIKGTASGTAVWGIRSDLVNGLPKGVDARTLSE